jgi:hypothetical protein
LVPVNKSRQVDGALKLRLVKSNQPEKFVSSLNEHAAGNLTDKRQSQPAQVRPYETSSHKVPYQWNTIKSQASYGSDRFTLTLILTGGKKLTDYL